MTDYMPALIGLLGVALGGFIQVISRAAKAKSDAAFLTRQRAAMFLDEVHGYLHFIEGAKASRQGGPVHAAYLGGKASRRCGISGGWLRLRRVMPRSSLV